MGNENYLNYYVEILTGTMTDAVIRNISLQANARVTEQVVTEQAKTIDGLKAEIERFKSEKENLSKGQNDTISNLNNQLTDYNRMKSEYDNIKHQVTHVDTFRSELIKERENHQKTRNEYELKIEELKNQIEYLQLTPAKRKKIDEEKNKQVEVIETPSALPLDDTTKDGGSF